MQQLQQIVHKLDRTKAFVLAVQQSLQTKALGLDEVEELISHLQNALEEAQTLCKTVCEQSEHLAAAIAAAHAERERSRYLFDHAPDAYIVTDLKGVIREANPQAAALLNTPLEFLSGVPIASFVQLDQRPVFRREFMRLGSVERIEEWDVSLQPHNMAAIQASLSVSSIPDPTGRATVLRWIVRDTTERKSVARLWRLMRGRQQAVCSVAKTELGLEMVVHVDVAAQRRELFSTWEQVLRRANSVRTGMKAEGWLEPSAVSVRRAEPA